MRLHRATSRRMQPPSRRRLSVGVSLIETMVAIVIALFVILAVANIYLSMRRSFAHQDELAQLQDSQRLVLTMLTNTLQSAGYFVDPLTNTAKTALPETTVAPEGGVQASFADGQAITGTSAASGSDTVAVQFQTAINDGLMNCQGGTNTSSATTVFVNSFAVNADNELTCAVGDGKAQVLAANVGEMKVLYATDTNADGAPDVYLSASDVEAGSLWPSVFTAQVAIRFLDTTTSKPGAPVLLAPLVQNIHLMNRR